MTRNVTSKISFFSRTSDNIAAFVLIGYGVGFLITNLYLGSMGIVTFELFKTRYITAGFLFMVFVGIIFYLVVGLEHTLWKNREKPPLIIVFNALKFSFLNIFLLFFVVGAIGLFGGLEGLDIYSLPDMPQITISWKEWFTKRPLFMLRSSAILWGGMLLLVVLILIVVNPKDREGIQKTRRQMVTTMLLEINREKIVGVFGSFLLVYILFVSGDLFVFYWSSNQTTSYPQANSALFGWEQFFIAISIIYVLFAIYLTSVALYPPTNEGSGKVGVAWRKTSSLIYLVTVLIIVIVPIYAGKIYPVLPQQIGGGQLQKVHVVLSDGSAVPQFGDVNVETYLIDRTANKSFFLVRDLCSKHYAVVEIQNHLIESITYAHFP